MNWGDDKIGCVFLNITNHEGSNYEEDTFFAPNNKQIKVFHYAEALGVKTKEEYNETLHEMKTLWFNEETKQFLKEQCNINF